MEMAAEIKTEYPDKKVECIPQTHDTGRLKRAFLSFVYTPNHHVETIQNYRLKTKSIVMCLHLISLSIYFQVILIHSHIGMADKELLPSVREQAKEVLLEKGVELVLGEM